MSPRALLIGAPGAGKTTVGKALAERLGVEFRDTDADIEQISGKSIPDIFLEDGESVFRDMETAALRRAITESDGVVALGGGAVLREENRELLADQPVVWLEVTLVDAITAVGLGTSRPLLMGNVRGRLLDLLKERTPLYEAVARHRVSNSKRSVDATVDDIITRIGASQ